MSSVKCELIGQIPSWFIYFALIGSIIGPIAEAILGNLAKNQRIPFGSIVGALAFGASLLLLKFKPTRENKS